MQLYHKSINDPILKWQNLTVSGKNVIYKLGDLYRKPCHSGKKEHHQYASGGNYRHQKEYRKGHEHKVGMKRLHGAHSQEDLHGLSSSICLGLQQMLSE